MLKAVFDISISLDGFLTAPDVMSPWPQRSIIEEAR